MSSAAIELRQAQESDAESLARLWATVFPDKFGPVLGQNAERVLCDWFRLSRRHLPTTTLAEIEGRLAGFIVLETAGAPAPDDGRWLWHALQLHYGLLGALRGLLLMWLIDQQHRPGPAEVYIEMLGVDPAHQGQGLAHRLLCHAEAVAQQQQARQLSLSVVIDNAPALHLYHKLGFSITGQHLSRPLRWVTGHAGVYLMVKELPGDAPP